MKLVTRILFAAIAATTAMMAGGAGAQAYPTKPITLVVAYPAGGDADVLARLLAEKLSGRLRQSVVVENRTGAAGTIGSAYVAKSAADGYTLLVAPNTVAIAPLVLKNGTGASYDVRGDFTPVAQLGVQSLFVVVNKGTGIASCPNWSRAPRRVRCRPTPRPATDRPCTSLASCSTRPRA